VSLPANGTDSRADGLAYAAGCGGPMLVMNMADIKSNPTKGRNRKTRRFHAKCGRTLFLFTFTGLAAGTYTIGIVPQAGYSTTQGSSEWTVTTTAGQTANGGSFGESAATGSIEGTVYNAANGYGIYNWAVYIDLNDSGTYETGDPYFVTGNSGGYTLSGLAPGTYIVRAAVYSNLPWEATQGSNGYTVTVTANQTAFGGDFGERYL
jgi:hypothetical protein